MHVYIDRTLSGAVVVKVGGQWFAVPTIPNGWRFRSPYRLVPEFRARQLQPCPAWRIADLGIPNGTAPAPPPVAEADKPAHVGLQNLRARTRAARMQGRPQRYQ